MGQTADADACVDEHASQHFDQAWWSSTFKNAIGAIGHTLMMLSPWHKPLTLTRAWCLWEAFCSVETGATFSVCLGQEERAAFLEAVVGDWHVVMKVFADINIRKAEAMDQKDLEMIDAAVRASEGGYTAVSAKIYEQMWGWVAHTMRQEVETRRDADGVLGEDDLELARVTAILLMDQGKTAEAEAL